MSTATARTSAISARLRLVDVARTLAELGRPAQGLATTSQLEAAGVPRWALARATAAGEVVRVRRRVYALAPLADLPRHVVTDLGVAPAYAAQVRAVLLSLGPSAAACGRTAAALYGWGMLAEPARTVEVAVPHGRGTQEVPQVRCQQRRSATRGTVQMGAGTTPVRITMPAQTVVDCALELGLLEAVVVCDIALRARQVTVEELLRAAGRLQGRREARRVRRMLDLCDPQSGSVLESVLRVQLRLAGVDGFVTQQLRAVRPRQLRVDFCFVAAALVVEVDGARWHQDRDRDRTRDNAVAVLGWRVLRFSWAQVVHEHPAVIADILAAIAATPTLQAAAQKASEAA